MYNLMMSDKASKTFRKTFRFHKEEMEALLFIKKRFDLKNDSDVLRKALIYTGEMHGLSETNSRRTRRKSTKNN